MIYCDILPSLVLRKHGGRERVVRDTPAGAELEDGLRALNNMRWKADFGRTENLCW